MEKNNQIWLPISFFASKRNWHTYLKEAISPLIKKLFDRSRLTAFRLQFNYLAGENVRLALKIPDTESLITAQWADHYLKVFIKAQQLLPIEKEAGFNKVFMSHPENTIRYGLYKIYDHEKYQRLNIIEEELSKCILGAFSDDLIDDEAIITFVFYLLFTSYKMVYAATPQLNKIWVQYYLTATAYFRVTEAEQKVIQVKCKEIAPLIGSIYAEIIASNISDELKWLQSWENVLVQIANEMSDVNDKHLVISEINARINIALGLNDFSYNLVCVSINDIFSLQK